MGGIPLTRCQFLIPFIEVLNETGAPTEGLLDKFCLPTSVVEKAHLFIPILPTIQFVEVAQRAQGIPDIGFLAARQMELCHLSPRMLSALAHAPTLFAALQQVCKLASYEDTNLRVWLEPHGDHVRICNRLTGTTGLPNLEHSQWLQLIFPIHIVRHYVGARWHPTTIAFESGYTPGRETRALWPNSRFLSGQPASWIDVPMSYLSLPSPGEVPPPAENTHEDDPASHEMIMSLKRMLPAYLDQGPPSLGEAAEIAGLSSRSFQRKLATAGISYSDLVDAARYENASRLLRDTQVKVIDIALSSGYSDHAHFTRAFRRMTGVTPRQFRRQTRLTEV